MKTQSGEVRIAFFLERHPTRDRDPWLSPVTEGIVEGLRERMAQVDLIVPENSLWDLSELRPKHDLYVLKSETAMALSLAGALTVAGAEVVNSFRAASLVRDKVAATAVLAGSAAPVPPSYAAGAPALLQPLLDEGPLWIKPQRGTKGAGIRRIALRRELDSHEECRDPYGLPLPLFAQKELPSSGKDLKVYVVGDKVWAIERCFPAVTESEKAGRPAPLPQAIREAALLCGRALRIELYGVDFLVSEDRFAAIDVNVFPGYKGIAEAPAVLAEYIHRRALSARNATRGKP